MAWWDRNVEQSSVRPYDFSEALLRIRDESRKQHAQAMKGLSERPVVTAPEKVILDVASDITPVEVEVCRELVGSIILDDASWRTLSHDDFLEATDVLNEELAYGNTNYVKFLGMGVDVRKRHMNLKFEVCTEHPFGDPMTYVDEALSLALKRLRLRMPDYSFEAPLVDGKQ